MTNEWNFNRHSRRAALKLLAAGAATAAMARFPAIAAIHVSDAAKAEGDVVVATAGGMLQDALAKHLYDGFTAATGIKVTAVTINPDEQWAKVMDINLHAPFRLMRAATDALIASGGSIVNVSSVNGLRSFPGLIAYCVSKSAVDHLTRCAALELASKGVRVNAVNPGVTVSNLHRRGGMSEESYEAFLTRSRETHPLGRPGQPDEIADVIFFLASGGAKFMTGETIPVDGGRHLTCAR